MLKLENVSKIYKTKAGEVKALDGVSLTFPASGLVFIVGKSGCGKTTLLNVIGGLDGIDGGEILVQDKKFSTFSAKEYDSYRNTFIGFIFQEYNLLPDYSVEKNVKIAMELQGRKADEAEFEKLLKDVEIDQLKERNPSELSGGQRQRVAIARALVKEPRIIMADEPTGALDSGTGVQVFDTLKKLSKDKLIIDVSHDLEFAERYADRIIQLVDGKVAQDITLVEKEIASNVNEQEDALVVREGADLSEEEKNLLAKAVKNRKKIQLIKNLSYRDKAPTGEIIHNAENAVPLRKSKMKLKSAAFLGLKSLVVKPLRLAITILISALAFAVFGLFDTVANFSTQSVLSNAIRNSTSPTATTTASYIVNFEAGDEYNLKVSDALLAHLQAQTNGKVKGVFDFRKNQMGSVTQTLSLSELISSDVIIGTKYYSKTVNGFVAFNEATELNANGTFKDFPYRLVLGRYPKIAYENDTPVLDSLYEVAISTYLAESILYYLNGNELNGEAVSTPEELLERTITVDDKTYTIVGLIDCGEIPQKYDVLKESTPYNVKTNALISDYNAYINAGAQKCLFVADGFKEAWNLYEETANVYHVGNVNWSFTVNGTSSKKQISSYVYNANDYDENNILLFKAPKQGESVKLGDDEILIHHRNLENLFATELASLPTEEARLARTMISSMASQTPKENRLALTHLITLLKKDLSSGYIPINLQQRYTETGEKVAKDLKIAGVYFGVDPNSATTTARYKLMMNERLMQALNVYAQQGDYNKILFSPAALRFGSASIVEYLTEQSGLTLHLYNNSTLNEIRENDLMIKQAANLFLYAAMALALLSVFLLYNYISTSIANKKQSVGVLRGLGACGKDILLTFLSESLIIAIVNGVLANVCSAIGCSLVNSYIVNIMNVSVHFAIFGIRQIVIISVISLLTAILSSALPIFKISRKKPVELIRRP